MTGGRPQRGTWQPKPPAALANEIARLEASLGARRGGPMAWRAFVNGALAGLRWALFTTMRRPSDKIVTGSDEGLA
jgi:hypothetical protein